MFPKRLVGLVLIVGLSSVSLACGGAVRVGAGAPVVDSQVSQASSDPVSAPIRKPDFTRPVLIDAVSTDIAAARTLLLKLDIGQFLAPIEGWAAPDSQAYVAGTGIDVIFSNPSIQVIITQSDGSAGLDASDLSYRDAQSFGTTVENVTLTPEVRGLRISGTSSDTLLIDIGGIRVNVIGEPGTYAKVLSLALGVIGA